MNLTDLKYYQNYHKHTSLSHRYNKDSPLVYNDYFNYYKDDCKNSPQIYSTVEHGWQGVYFRIYDDLEKFNKKNDTNIKFIFGTEAYWVKDRFQKDSSNCHIVLLAMNNNGRKKINRAIYESFKSGYYYKNRMDLDILLSLPKDDVFVTTACIAFWNKYDDIDDIVLKLNNHFTNFYLEVQPHHTEQQKQLNKHILDLHYKYNIPLIAGTDSHIISDEQIEDREDLLRSNSIRYEDEQGWFIDLPSLEIFIKRFQEQGILNDDEIYEAINNTNKILEFEDIILDRSLKVPVLKQYRNKTQEERNQILKDIITKEWNAQINDINVDKRDQYFKEIQHDYNEIIGCNMADYFIDTYEIMKRGINEYGGVLTPTGRGSAVSSYINKLLRFTKVDKVNADVLMYSERFLTKERVLDSHTPPDIDHNVADREPFIQAQRDLIGESGTFDLIALGTLKYKSAFKMYARAYNLNPEIANEVTKQIDKYETALKHAEDDEKDLIDIFDYVDEQKYGKLIEGCQRYKGIIDNLKGHPCFTKDALVMTDKGYKTIDKINVGDNVLTVDNNYHKVKQLMQRKTNDIYSLSIQGSVPFEVTGNHPFFTSKRKYTRNKSTKKDVNRRELENYKWKQVQDLEEDDLIGVAINQNSILPTIDFIDSSNKNFWWCLGRYFGDGWRTHTVRKSGKEKGKKIKDVIICCNKSNDETNDIIKHLDWCEYRISECETVNRIYLKCKGLYNWLDQFGDYANGKHFTNTIFDLPQEYLQVFLDGYISADGHLRNNIYNITTINKMLAYGIVACVHKAYRTPCAIQITKPSENGKEFILGREVNSHSRYRISFKKYSSKQDRGFYQNGYIWYRYKTKSKLNTYDTVYNFEVEENHTYTVNNYIVHNCGTICFDGDVIEDIGVIMVKPESQSGDKAKETFVAVIESGTIDAFGYLKQDYLIVDSIGLTYEIYKEIGIEPLSINQLINIIKNNERVWNIYKNGYTVCVNQCEQAKSTQKVMRFSPKNIAELTQFVAGIRPSFQSMYKTFEQRQHFDYGIKAFDELIQDEFCDSSFILYQEHLMKVLGFAGFPMSDTYTIIKAISKKKNYIIQNAKERFIPYFKEAILNTGQVDNETQALQMAKKVWQVVEDSASYGFNSAHAYCMALDSVTLAYLKEYYPLEFYKVTLQRYTDKGNKNKVTLLKQEMLRRGFKLNPIQFGDDNRAFSINQEYTAINQTMSSIKNMQKITPQIMYDNKDLTFNNVFELFDFIKNCGINKTSREILIKLNYFSKFAEPKQLLQGFEIYDKYINAKVISKSKLTERELEYIKPYCDKETPSQLRELNNEKIIFNLIKNANIPKTTDIDLAHYQLELLGYTDIIVPNCDYYGVESIEVNNYGTPFLTLYHLATGTTQQFKCNKKWFNEYECKQGAILNCSFQEKQKRRFAGVDENGKNVYEPTGETESVIKCYSEVIL